MNIRSFQDLDDVLIAGANDAGDGDYSMDNFETSGMNNHHNRKASDNIAHMSSIDDTYADDFDEEDDGRRVPSPDVSPLHSDNKDSQPTAKQGDQSEPNFGVPFVDDDDISYQDLRVVNSRPDSPSSESPSTERVPASTSVPLTDPSPAPYTVDSLQIGSSLSRSHSPDSASSNSTISTNASSHRRARHRHGSAAQTPQLSQSLAYDPRTVQFRAQDTTVRSSSNVVRRGCGGFSRVNFANVADIPGLKTKLRAKEAGTRIL
jgi:hypothetical protein